MSEVSREGTSKKILPRPGASYVARSVDRQSDMRKTRLGEGRARSSSEDDAANITRTSP